MLSEKDQKLYMEAFGILSEYHETHNLCYFVTENGLEYFGCCEKGRNYGLLLSLSQIPNDAVDFITAIDHEIACVNNDHFRDEKFQAIKPRLYQAFSFIPGFLFASVVKETESLQVVYIDVRTKDYYKFCFAYKDERFQNAGFEEIAASIMYEYIQIQQKKAFAKAQNN
ncbi:MAG: hypothetical protein KDK91_34385 [Gammaproteobacteria bacterium]|nr:hypothetical protein [Gammaproteobacteria bacterium]